MTKFSDSFIRAGMATYFFKTWQGFGPGVPPLESNQTPGTPQDTIDAYNTYYLPVALRCFGTSSIYNGREIYQLTLNQQPLPACWIIEVLDPAGYGPQTIDYIGPRNPNLICFELRSSVSDAIVWPIPPASFPNYSLVPRLYGLIPNVSMAEHDVVLAAWKAQLLAMQQAVPTAPGFIGLQDAIASDGQVNGGMGGVGVETNPHTIQLFVNSPDFPLMLNANGTHKSDGSPCLVYQNYVSNPVPLDSIWNAGNYSQYQPNILPAPGPLFISLALDLTNYHCIFDGQHFSREPGTWSHFVSNTQFRLEYELMQYASSIWGYPFSFLHTLCFGGDNCDDAYALMEVPGYYENPLQVEPDLSNQPAGNFAQAAPTMVQTLWLYLARMLAHGGRGHVPWVSSQGLVNTADQAALSVYFMNVVVPYSAHDILLGELADVPQNYPQMLDPSVVRFGTLLNRMRYIGGWFGVEETPLRILTWTHNPALPSLYNLGQVWTQNLAEPVPANLNALYDAIFISTEYNYNPSYESYPVAQLINFAANGGTVVAMVHGNGGDLLEFMAGAPGGDWTALMGAVIANRPGATPPWRTDDPANPVIANYNGQDIIDAYIQAGWSGPFVALTTGAPIVSGPDGPVIWQNRIGRGNVIVIIDMNPANSLAGTEMGAGSWFLVANAITSGKGLPTPAISIPRFALNTGLAGVSVAGAMPYGPMIYGSKAGVKRVWLSNMTAAAKRVQLIYSAAYFGFPAKYSVLNENSQQYVALSASGDFIVDVNAPANDWTPLLIQGTSGLTPTQTVLTAKAL